MIKKYALILFSIFCFSSASAQNEIIVQQVINPRASITYFSVDSFDFVVRIKNMGPNELLPGDIIKVSYSIGDGSAATVVDSVNMPVGGTRNMAVGEGRTYTIVDNFKINGNNAFSACASIIGTGLYPTNTSKDSEDCERFIVGIEKQSLNIEKVYYADNQIYLNINHSTKLRLEIFDITGKLLLEKNIQSKVSETIPFTAPANGFYLIKLISDEGTQASSKFVVN